MKRIIIFTLNTGTPHLLPILIPASYENFSNSVHPDEMIALSTAMDRANFKYRMVQIKNYEVKGLNFVGIITAKAMGQSSHAH